MTEPVLDRIHSYRTKLLTDAEWADWGPSIVNTIKTVRPTEVPDAARLIAFTTRYAADLIRWGFGPPIEQHFTVARIERHVSQFGSEGSKRTRRGELVAVGRVVNPSHPWPVVQQKLRRSQREAPYSKRELGSLIRAADAQQGDIWQRLFQTAFSLGLHGHDGRTAPYITRERIDFGSRPDGVVILSDDIRPDMLIQGLCGRWIEHWCRRVDIDEPLVGPHSRFNTRLSTLRADDNTTRLVMARLRTTFIVHLLSQRTLLQCEILQLAGMTSTATLDHYRVHLPERDRVETGERFAAGPPIIRER